MTIDTKHRTPMILDLFAGPGGWDTGVRQAGYEGDLLGIEWDEAACATARAAGHDRLQADIAQLDPRDFRGANGLITSPPCQGFSMAGKGKGRDDAEHLLHALDTVRTASDVDAAIAELTETMTDPRSTLALQPLRWALALTPSWLAWEQVPAVQPIWDACAEVLRRVGYSVDTGVVSAEQYGVPQTRKRAILVARAPWETAARGPAALPAPTHSRYYSRNPSKLDEGVQKWVSMDEALGWGMTERPYLTIAAGTAAGGADAAMLGGSGARASLNREKDAGRWKAAKNMGAGMVERYGERPGRDLDQPAFTVRANAGGSEPGGFVWKPSVMAQAGTSSTMVDPRPVTSPAGTITGKATAQWGERSERAARANDADPKGVRVTVAEAAVLQSFPADYPWQGSKTAQFRQVGDAVPPGLAAAVVAPLIAAYAAVDIAA